MPGVAPHAARRLSRSAKSTRANFCSISSMEGPFKRGARSYRRASTRKRQVRRAEPRKRPGAETRPLTRLGSPDLPSNYGLPTTDSSLLESLQGRRAESSKIRRGETHGRVSHGLSGGRSPRGRGEDGD